MGGGGLRVAPLLIPARVQERVSVSEEGRLVGGGLGGFEGSTVTVVDSTVVSTRTKLTAVFMRRYQIGLVLLAGSRGL